MYLIKEDGLSKTVSLTLPFTELRQGIDKKLERLAKTVSIAGFRQGKVPTDIIKQKYGRSLLSEVAEDLMKDHFLKMAVAKHIKLAGVISMEPKQLDFNKDFIFEVSYEVYPEVDVTISPTTKFEKITAEVTQEDINYTIKDMRIRAAKYEDVLFGVEARNEHIAIIDFEAVTTDNEKQKFSQENMTVEIDSTYPSPQFVNQIKGMKEGEQKSFQDKVKLNIQSNQVQSDGQRNQDANPNNAAVSEKEATFNVRVKKLQKRVLPEVNQDFFKLYGVTGSEKEFQEQIRKNMEYELNLALSRIQYHKVADIVLNMNKKLEVPATHIEREAERMRDTALQRWQQLIKGRSAPSKDKLPLDLFRQKAEEKIRTGLFLGELAKKEKLKPSEEQVVSNIRLLAQTYENPDEVEKQYQNNQTLKEQVYNKLLEDMAMDKFMSKLEINEKKVSYKEALSVSSQLA